MHKGSPEESVLGSEAVVRPLSHQASHDTCQYHSYKHDQKLPIKGFLAHSCEFLFPM
jgi:hypothetical protein